MRRHWHDKCLITRIVDKSFLIAVSFISLGFVLVMFVAVPDVPSLPVLIIAAGVAGLFFLFWFFGTYLPILRFKPLERRFGFRSSRDSPEILRGNWEGHEVRIAYEEWRRSERAKLFIQLTGKSFRLPTVLFHRESFSLRLSKGIGLSREVQSGDPTFDSQVYVESPDDGKLEPLLRSPDVRLQVLSLLQIRRSAISLSPNAVSLTIRGHIGWTRHFHPDEMENILRRLTALAHEGARVLEGKGASVSTAPKTPVDHFETKNFKERMALLRNPGMAAIFLASLLILLGPILLIWGSTYPPVSWRLHNWGLTLAVLSLLIYLPIIFSCFRGRSDSHRQFSTFLLIGVIAFPSFWIGLFTVGNGLFDRRTPVVVETMILKRLPRDSKVRVYLDLGGEGPIFTVKLKRALYQTVKEGEPLRVLVSPGALDEPWVVGPADKLRRGENAINGGIPR